MTSFQITDEQKSFFDEFGFLVFRQFFSPEEMETIGREAQAAFDEIYPEGREGGTHGRWVALMGPSTPFSASLLEDERIYTIAGRTFDESIIGLNVDMLEWYADTGWHRDLDVPGEYRSQVHLLHGATHCGYRLPAGRPGIAHRALICRKYRRSSRCESRRTMGTT